jgi:hypothetical protein
MISFTSGLQVIVITFLNKRRQKRAEESCCAAHALKSYYIPELSAHNKKC